MLREVDLKDISDGKFYGNNDLVKAGCEDCKGCSACCEGMGNSIVLNPLDIYEMTKGLEKTFEELLVGNLELNVVDGLILPNLKMGGEKEACSFLNAEGRCSIHPYRPGICRIFPLGRYYEEEGFQYFLQTHECKKENRTKVKVKKWIDTKDLKMNEQFINDWHKFQKRMQDKIETNEEEGFQKALTMYVLKLFYMLPYEKERDFYEQFYERMAEIKF